MKKKETVYSISVQIRKLVYSTNVQENWFKVQLQRVGLMVAKSGNNSGKGWNVKVYRKQAYSAGTSVQKTGFKYN